MPPDILSLRHAPRKLLEHAYDITAIRTRRQSFPADVSCTNVCAGPSINKSNQLRVYTIWPTLSSTFFSYVAISQLLANSPFAVNNAGKADMVTGIRARDHTINPGPPRVPQNDGGTGSTPPCW